MSEQASDATLLLRTMSSSMGISARLLRRELHDGTVASRVEASHPDGRHWSIDHPDPLGAALELATLLGFDVMDS